MSDEASKSVIAVQSIWTRLISSVRLSKDVADDTLTASAVERQTENSLKGGTIWEVVRRADQVTMERLVKEDPTNIDARGPVGERPIHMLFLYGTEAHLNIARYLIKKFPRTITQIYDEPAS
jgi:phytoene dehydrogenase-like protein